MSNAKRIYLAGPDVFERDPHLAGSRLKDACAARGLEGVYPLDVGARGDSPAAIAHHIYWNNLALIKSCDAVLANTTPFRGPSADVGTAWEMGFATALGLPVAACTASPHPYDFRVLMNTPNARVDDDYPDGKLVERFGLTDNLMLACCAQVFRYVDAAIAWLADRLGVVR